MIGLAANGPPDGLMSVASPSPSASRRMSSWWLKTLDSSATSIPSCDPSFLPLASVDGDVVRSRVPK